MGLKAFDYFAVIYPTSIVPYIVLFVNTKIRRVYPFPLEGAEGVFRVCFLSLTCFVRHYLFRTLIHPQRRWRAGLYPDKAATKGG